MIVRRRSFSQPEGKAQLMTVRIGEMEIFLTPVDIMGSRGQEQ